MMWGEAAAQLAQVLPLTPLQKLIPKQSDNNIKTMPPAKVSILRKPGSAEKNTSRISGEGHVQDWGTVGSGDCGSMERSVPNPVTSNPAPPCLK